MFYKTKKKGFVVNIRKNRRQNSFSANDDKISMKDVRDTLYSRYDAEIKNLWEHSAFVWGFELLLFTGYGYLFSKVFIGNYTSQINNYEIITFLVISFIGLCISAIWIALAKAAKARQEVFESQIVELESNTKYFDLQRIFAMGGFHNRLKELDSNLFKTSAGKFSPGRLNIFIAQFAWFIWFIIAAFHFMICHLERPYKICIFFLYIIFYVFFFLILIRTCGNQYLEKEDYGIDYLFDSFEKIKKLEKEISFLSEYDIESLKKIILEKIPSLPFIWNKEFSDLGMRDSYVELTHRFKSDYIISKNDKEFVNKYKNEACYLLNNYRFEIEVKMLQEYK